jgi:hypothetical protein
VAGIGVFANKGTQPAASEASASESTAGATRVPVLVELFTSEGCSSCPPADALLSRLEKTQPIPGAEIIALSEHVDYWNRLGWRDPYSSVEFSERQNRYSNAFETDEVFTPQMIVDGRVQFVGSNESDARKAIADAVSHPKASVMISLVSGNVPESGDSATAALSVRVEGLKQIEGGESVDVLLAITESGLHSNVTRGENSGRVLNHISVVRKLSTLGTIDAKKDKEDEPFTAQPVLRLSKTWKRDSIKIVVFAQERLSRRVLAVTALQLASRR